MKAYQFLFAVLCLVLFSSCTEEKTEVFQSSSNDGVIQITVQGSRYNSLDPYKVNITTQYKENVNTASVEVQASELTKDNVKFNWVNNRYCVVELIQRDGSVRSVPVRFEGI